MRHLILNTKRGLTLTELLAVLMIIGLLATIAVPVYVARQEDARIRVARGETREIAMAEEQVAIAHGFYVPFQLLDDLPADPDQPTPFPRAERIDLNPDATNIYLISPFETALSQLVTQPRLIDGYGNTPPNAQVRNMVQNWAGPFLQFQRFWYRTDNTAPYEGPADQDYRNHEDQFRDFPLDPWGNPYRFYSQLGVIGDGGTGDEDEFDFDSANNPFSNGNITEDDPDRFSRYAVVSYGRDGIRDTDGSLPIGFEPNDIFYEFGINGLSRNFGKY